MGVAEVHDKETLYKGPSKLKTYPILMILLNQEPHILFPFSQNDEHIWLGTQIIQKDFKIYDGDFDDYCFFILNKKISPMHSNPQGSKRKITLQAKLKCTFTNDKVLLDNCRKRYKQNKKWSNTYPVYSIHYEYTIKTNDREQLPCSITIDTNSHLVYSIFNEYTITNNDYT